MQARVSKRFEFERRKCFDFGDLKHTVGILEASRSMGPLQKEPEPFMTESPFNGPSITVSLLSSGDSRAEPHRETE